MRKRRIMAMTLAAVMAASLTACGGPDKGNTAGAPGQNQESAAKDSGADSTEGVPSDSTGTGGGQVTLTYWSWLPTVEQSETMIADFEKANPDIKIDYIRTEQDDYFEKLKVAMASGTGPDLFGLTTGPMARQYAPFTEDMKGLADQYLPGWDKIISGTAVNQCVTEDGHMVGMPLLVAGMTDLLYNKTLMDECGIEKVPATYAELKDAAEKAKAKGYVCVAAGAADDWINSDWFVQISNEFEEGAVYEAEQGKRPWTDQCFVDTMKAWQNLFNDGIFEDGAPSPDARDQYFFAGKAVFFLTGSWHLGPVSPSAPEIQGTEISNRKDIIGMSVFPSMTEDGTICGTSGVDIVLAVNKDCKEKEAAMRFVDYMSNGEGQQYWVNRLQGAPVSSEIQYTGTVDGELQQQSIDEVNYYVSNAVGNRKLVNSEIETAIQVAMQNVAAGADPAQELKGVQNVADAQ